MSHDPDRQIGRFEVAGLFAGIGGIEAGLSRAGHDTVLLCEKDEQARAVLEERFPGIPVHDDVSTLDELPDGIDLVSAGFPCQDLSQAGKSRGMDGERSSLVSHLFRLLETNDVPWVLIENVPFMLRLDGGAAMEYLVSRFEDLGYSWAYRVVDSRAFGLPQRRRRVYLLASRAGNPRIPLLEEDHGPPGRPSHEGRACGFYWTEGNRGLGWAVDSIPPLKGGSGVGIPSAPAVWMPDGRIVTPDIRDAERLQGFQADWTLPAESKGRASARWKLVGNAVSVPVSEWIGSRLGSCLECTDDEWTYHPMEQGSWPKAAWGDGSNRFAMERSGWPRMCPHPPLADFFQHEPKPLSERATSGFWNRLRKSSLNYPPEFGKALEAHLERKRGCRSGG